MRPAPSIPSTAPSASDTPGWWTFGHVWLVLAGPLLVVLASLITMYIAYTRVDPMVDENYYQKGLALSPAVQSRDRTDPAFTPASVAESPRKP